jgi:uncharacterized Ntn-hydrolase superfamily protein
MKPQVFVMLLICGLISISSFPQSFYSDEPLAHTYSIVARDTITGDMGVAVQSNWFSVGSIVSWGEAGVGVVVTQSFVNVSFGPRGLELLKSGLTAQQVIDSLIAADEGRDVRQLAIVDAKGNAAAYTGKNCIPEAGHIAGNNFSVQANLMLNNTVWKAMAAAFQRTKGPLAERMIAALEAAQNEGGDIRGQQSAAILVVNGTSTGKIWEDRIIDLRVEDHPNAVEEIKRVLKVYRAYEHMNNGDLAVEHGDMELAMKEYSAAENMFPENAEMKYWHAVTLINIGKFDESLPLFHQVFKANENWRILTPRLISAGLLNVNAKQLETILSQGE